MMPLLTLVASQRPWHAVVLTLSSVDAVFMSHNTTCTTAYLSAKMSNRSSELLYSTMKPGRRAARRRRAPRRP